MTGPGFVLLPPDIDDAEPETDCLCGYCGAVLPDGSDDEDDCVVCQPRCLVEDSPVRFSATLDGDRVRFEAVEVFGFKDGDRLALMTWEGGCGERRCVGVRELTP